MAIDWVADMIEDGLRMAADVGGNSFYDISRPDYSSATTASTVVERNQKMRVDRSGGTTAAEPFFQGVTYFSIANDRSLNLQPGDILTPNPRKNVSIPEVTIQNLDDKKDMIAFRSNRKGSLRSSKGTVLFDNVRFELFTQGNVEAGFNDGDTEGSQPFTIIKAVMIRRPGISVMHRLVDDATNEIFDIQTIEGTEFVVALTLRGGKVGRR
jgi:hypothetical protein